MTPFLVQVDKSVDFLFCICSRGWMKPTRPLHHASWSFLVHHPSRPSYINSLWILLGTTSFSPGRPTILLGTPSFSAFLYQQPLEGPSHDPSWYAILFGFLPSTVSFYLLPSGPSHDPSQYTFRFGLLVSKVCCLFIPNIYLPLMSAYLNEDTIQ